MLELKVVLALATRRFIGAVEQGAGRLIGGLELRAEGSLISMEEPEEIGYFPRYSICLLGRTRSGLAKGATRFERGK